MKLKIFILLSIVSTFYRSYGQIDTITSRLIDSLKVEDQKWRNLPYKILNKEVDSITLEKVQQKIMETDSLNYLIIKKLFVKEGYLGNNKIGVFSAHNFWLLIQHADKHPDFQIKVLESMKVEADKGNASLKDYAYLIDRVKINNGELQIYGTQMELDSTETSYKPKPVIDPDKLDERRKSVGLMPIEQYIKFMNENCLVHKHN
jgi:hypothetical protein